MAAPTAPNDNYFSDFASFAEIAIKAVGHTAAMPVPGTLSQYVSKSGGNAYHGNVYADFQNDALEATNIDDDQIARGVSGGPGLDVRDVNRLQRFRDFNADVGGYLKKDKAWWYGAYRSTAVSSSATPGCSTRRPRSTADGRHRQGHLPALATPEARRLSAARDLHAVELLRWPARASRSQTSDALPSIVFPVNVWKGEYNAAVTDALYVEARVGGYHLRRGATFKSTAPRIADVGANTVSGGALAPERLIDRPQVNGSLSFLKTGWGGSHTFRIGGEYMIDRARRADRRLRQPLQLRVDAEQRRAHASADPAGPERVEERPHDVGRFRRRHVAPQPRVTLSLGLRLDRYQPSPPGAGGTRRADSSRPIDPVLTFSNWGPRVGHERRSHGRRQDRAEGALRQVLGLPGATFTAAFNPNPSGWSQTYLWTNDANGNGRWDPGEEGRLIAVSGGSASTRLDPDIANTYVHQATRLHRARGGAGLRRADRRGRERQAPAVRHDQRQPAADAYSVPVAVVDPGPDGRLGSADDGATLTAYDLAAESREPPPVNLTTNLPDSNSEYYTWEITATKRQSARWSLLASFTETWNREAALGTGNDFTPNALINAAGSQDRFTTWQAKVNGTMSLPLGFRVVPVVRHQSGNPFARTFVRTLNYGNATIKAEPIAANRTPNITLVDLRTEKAFRVRPCASWDSSTSTTSSTPMPPDAARESEEEVQWKATESARIRSDG